MSLKVDKEKVNENKFINSDVDDKSTDEMSNTIVLYKKRYFILTLFILCSFTNAYQWIHLNIISDRVAFFWNNSLPVSSIKRELTINWLSMVYMLAYVPLIIPAMWFLEKKGLKQTSVIACGLNALGAWIKCFSVSLDGGRFVILFVGQTCCALSQIFILGIPAHLAAVWFGPNEVSRATSLGVFGNQLGIGFGFVIPPLFIPSPSENSTMQFYKEKFDIMFYSTAGVTTLILVVICIVFDRKPPKPPSKGQLFIQQNAAPVNYKLSLCSLATNTNFVLLIITYGINTGCFYAISTNLNNILLCYFSKGNSSSIGLAGFLMILSGVVASLCIGVILDRTKAFKSCVVTIYILSAVSMGLFTGGLFLYSWAVVFITMILIGLFMTGYLPLGFEIAAEMTYPANEGLTSGILNLSAQLFGICFTYTGTLLLEGFGPLSANLCFLSFLTGGVILTIIMRIDQRRQKAHFLGSEFEVESNSITTGSTFVK